jgi:hypothetical protein
VLAQLLVAAPPQLQLHALTQLWVQALTPLPAASQLQDQEQAHQQVQLLIQAQALPQLWCQALLQLHAVQVLEQL